MILDIDRVIVTAKIRIIIQLLIIYRKAVEHIRVKVIHIDDQVVVSGIVTEHNDLSVIRANTADSIRQVQSCAICFNRITCDIHV